MAWCKPILLADSTVTLFATTYIGVASELGDDEHLSTDIEKRKVHLTLVVSKDTQADNFLSKGLDLKFAIVLPYSKKDH